MTKKFKKGESVGALFRILQKVLGIVVQPEEMKRRVQYVDKNYEFSIKSLDVIVDVDLPQVEVLKLSVSDLKLNLPKKVFKEAD
jgi:hypothetical protein